MSIIDFHGVLSFYDFHAPPQQPGAQRGVVPTSGEHLAAERKVCHHDSQHVNKQQAECKWHDTFQSTIYTPIQQP